MSLLVLQLPTRARLHPQVRASAQGAGAPSELAWVLSPDGRAVQSEGRCAAGLLPRATTVVAVLAPADVAFHRLTCPKAPTARLRAALGGVMEDLVLDEVEALHLALPNDHRPGEQTWVAATDRTWLTGQITALEAAGVPIDRIVPGLWPDTPAHGYFHVPYETDKPQPHLTWADAHGVATWPLLGGLSRGLLPEPLQDDTRWTAEPAAATPAERWLGQPVQVLSAASHLLAATQSGWNLRQFDLAPSHRGLAHLRDAARQFMTPGWWPVRLGLIGLVLVHLVGLNAWAWVQRDELQTRRTAMLSLLRTTHPQVKAVLDAPVQMQRENEALRMAAGRAGDSDLESLLRVAASVWPEGRPLQNLRYEGGQLTLSGTGLAPDDLNRMRGTLAPSGWALDGSGNQLTLSRQSGSRASASGASPR